MPCNQFFKTRKTREIKNSVENKFEKENKKHWWKIKIHAHSDWIKWQRNFEEETKKTQNDIKTNVTEMNYSICFEVSHFEWDSYLFVKCNNKLSYTIF